MLNCSDLFVPLSTSKIKIFKTTISKRWHSGALLSIASNKPWSIRVLLITRVAAKGRGQLVLGQKCLIHKVRPIFHLKAPQIQRLPQTYSNYPTGLYRLGIGRAHVSTPVTVPSRMP